MSFLSLPTELLLDIGEHKCLTRKDHWSLILVNQRCFGIFMQILCREIRIKFPRHHFIPESRPSFKFAIGDSILQKLLERLDDSPHLRACVRKCRIENLICRHQYYPPIIDRCHPEWLLDPLFTLIGQFIHLDSICFSKSYIPANWMLYLARKPGPRLIELSDTHTYNEGRPGGSFRTVALTTNAKFLDSFARSLTFSESLVHLRLPKISLPALTTTHASSGKPMLRALKYLGIGAFGNDGFQFLVCTPNLIELGFLDESKRAFPPHQPEGWNKVLPKLKTIKCLYISLQHFTTGRPVTSISLDYGIHLDLLTMPRYFGSNMPVKKIYVGLCDHVPELLSYIIGDNIEIEELAIIYKPTDPKQYMQNIITNWLPLLKCLDHIRILQLQHQVKASDTFIPSLDDLNKEQKVCEGLRAEGCPNIAKVCFSPGTIWSFSQYLGLWEKEEWSNTMPLVLVEI